MDGETLALGLGDFEIELEGDWLALGLIEADGEIEAEGLTDGEPAKSPPPKSSILAAVSLN